LEKRKRGEFHDISHVKPHGIPTTTKRTETNFQKQYDKRSEMFGHEAQSQSNNHWWATT